MFLTVRFIHSCKIETFLFLYEWHISSLLADTTECDPIVHGGISGSSGTLLLCCPPSPASRTVWGLGYNRGAMINRDFVCLIVCVRMCVWFGFCFLVCVCVPVSICVLSDAGRGWGFGGWAVSFSSVLWLWLIGWRAPACGGPGDRLCIGRLCREAFCSPIDPNMSIRQTQINVPSTLASPPYAEPPM